MLNQSFQSIKKMKCSRKNCISGEWSLITLLDVALQQTSEKQKSRKAEKENIIKG